MVTAELESIASSPCHLARTSNSLVELVTLSKAISLVASDVSSHVSLCLWTGSAIHWCQDSPESLTEWINEGNLKEFVCGIFANPVRIQDSQSPTVV